MDRKKFVVELKKQTENSEKIVMKYLPDPEDKLQHSVMEAMNYSVTVGGKRLRPLLIQETYRMFRGQDDYVEPFMAAIEMIHTYSLVHDDLPCLDNDTLRRGCDTTWKKYGDAMALLAGDGLLNYAYETAMKSFDLIEKEGSAFEVSPETEVSRYQSCAKALGILAEKAGIYGMVGGQTVDVIGTGKSFSEEELLFIYRLKTGALLEASMMVGAILAGADEDSVQTMEQVAADVGLAFQIQDDILDVTSTVEELGKAVFSDEKNKKTTYVSLFGIEESGRTVELLTDRALKRLSETSTGTEEDGFLRELLLSLVHRTK